MVCSLALAHLGRERPRPSQSRRFDSATEGGAQLSAMSRAGDRARLEHLAAVCYPGPESWAAVSRESAPGARRGTAAPQCASLPQPIAPQPVTTGGQDGSGGMEIVEFPSMRHLARRSGHGALEFQSESASWVHSGCISLELLLPLGVPVTEETAHKDVQRARCCKGAEYPVLTLRKSPKYGRSNGRRAREFAARLDRLGRTHV